MGAEISKTVRSQLEHSTLESLLTNDKVSHSANFESINMT